VPALQPIISIYKKTQLVVFSNNVNCIIFFLFKMLYKVISIKNREIVKIKAYKKSYFKKNKLIITINKQNIKVSKVPLLI
jgi:hypothetical protein